MTRHDVWRRAREFGGAFYYQLAKNRYQHRPETGHRETKERNPHYTPVPQSVKVTAVFCLRYWKIIAQKLSCISYGANCELNWTPHQMNLQFFSECTRPVGWKHDPDHSLLAPALRPSPVQDSQTRACKCAHNFFVAVAGPQVTDTRKPARLLFLSRNHGKTMKNCYRVLTGHQGKIQGWWSRSWWWILKIPHLLPSLHTAFSGHTPVVLKPSKGSKTKEMWSWLSASITSSDWS